MPKVLPHLLKPEIGWGKATDVVGEKNTVFIAPWARKDTTEGGLLWKSTTDYCNTSVNADTMMLNRDYFTDQYKVLNYLRKHGFNRVDTVSPSTVERGRKRQPPQNIMAPAAAAAAHASTNATMATTAIEELPKAQKQKSKSSSSSSSASNAISSPIPENHQRLLTLLGSLKYANRAGTLIDEEFRPEHLALRAESLPPFYPPLNLSHFGSVWKVLAANNTEWHWMYGPLGDIHCRTREIGPRTDLSKFREHIDYFRSEKDLLEFVHGQFLAHGDNVKKYVEFAESVFSSKEKTYLISKEEYVELTGTQVQRTLSTHPHPPPINPNLTIINPLSLNTPLGFAGSCACRCRRGWTKEIWISSS